MGFRVEHMGGEGSHRRQGRRRDGAFLVLLSVLLLVDVAARQRPGPPPLPVPCVLGPRHEPAASSARHRTGG